MIGRSAALLTELPVEIQPSAWRLTAHPGRDLRRARDFLARDLDLLQERAADFEGTFKVQVTGPWTLAAWLELPSGNRIVSDHGASRELAQSLADGIEVHLADLARRLPKARIVVQVDEPSLPDVIAARIKTASGFGTFRGIDHLVAEQTLRDVLGVIPAGARVVHCCAADVPIELLRNAGADAVSIEAALISDLDVLGEAVEAGVSLWLGVLPSLDSPISLAAAREPIERIWRTLGFPDAQLASSVVPTPACGLGGASPAYARRVLAVLRDVGAALLDAG